MSKIYYLVIEDCLWKSFERAFPAGSNPIICKTYDNAVAAIDQLVLEENDALYVILDRDLGSSAACDGVALFFKIKQSFPKAYIVNFSSDPEAFSDEISQRGWTGELFDASIGKEPLKCAKLVLSHSNKALSHEAEVNKSDVSTPLNEEVSAESVIKLKIAINTNHQSSFHSLSRLFCCFSFGRTSVMTVTPAHTEASSMTSHRPTKYMAIR